MDISFSYFAENMAGNPILIVTVLLTLGVIFVNGWTDAPNAIATCVTTRCLSPRKAILLKIQAGKKAPHNSKDCTGRSVRLGN